MKVLVTGAGGMLGRDVVAAAKYVEHDVVACDRTGLDVTDPDAVREKLARVNPAVVINCAAWTDVDGAEENEEAATRLNAEAAGSLAAACAEIAAEIVHVSTDYVFDGEKDGPYVESDEPRPIQAYGRSKLAGEYAVSAANRRSYIVRTSWLFGVGGSNFVETMLRLADTHGEVLVVHDQIGSPTYTWHLAYGIVRLIEGAAYGLHHMTASDSCSWYDFAREIFDQAGVECRVFSATSDMLAGRAPRPKNSVLVSERMHAITLPDWRSGLRGYLEQREASS